MQTMTKAEWLAEGKRRFGPHVHNWQFVCPACGHVAAVQDWQDAGAPDTAVAFSCVGRWSGAKREALCFFPSPGKVYEGPGPCNYAGGGLFQANPVEVDDGGKKHRVFAFAEPEGAPVERAVTP